MLFNGLQMIFPPNPIWGFLEISLPPNQPEFILC